MERHRHRRPHFAADINASLAIMCPEPDHGMMTGCIGHRPGENSVSTRRPNNDGDLHAARPHNRIDVSLDVVDSSGCFQVAMNRRRVLRSIPAPHSNWIGLGRSCPLVSPLFSCTIAIGVRRKVALRCRFFSQSLFGSSSSHGHAPKLFSWPCPTHRRDPIRVS